MVLLLLLLNVSNTELVHISTMEFYFQFVFSFFSSCLYNYCRKQDLERKNKELSERQVPLLYCHVHSLGTKSSLKGAA